MFKGCCSGHAKSLFQLSDQLPGIQSITQVDEARRAIDNWWQKSDYFSLAYF